MAHHLVIASVAACLAAIVSCGLGHSGLTILATYAVAGALGLVAASVGVGLTRVGDTGGVDPWNEDPTAVALKVKLAVDAASRGPDPRVVVMPIRPVERAPVPTVRSHLTPSLGPAWSGEASAWPEATPDDLRLRLLDVMSYSSSNPDDIWDEIRAWMRDHAVDCPATLLGPPSAVQG